MGRLSAQIDLFDKDIIHLRYLFDFGGLFS